MERDTLPNGRRKSVNVLAAIQQDIGAGRAHTVDRKASASSPGSITGRIAGNADQVIRVARQSRQFCDLLLRHRVRELLSLGVDCNATFTSDHRDSLSL